MKGKSKRACRNNKEWRRKCREHVLAGHSLKPSGAWGPGTGNNTHVSMRAGYGLGRGR